MTESPSKSSSSKRRINKPLMERKRRARINESLNQLKTLVLTGMKKDPTRYNRLEKADILEMTVNHLKSLQKQQLQGSLNKNPEVMTKYQRGFSECAREVSNYLSLNAHLDSGVQEKIVGHLNNCKQRVDESISLTTNMHAEVYRGQSQDSDSNSSDDETSPVEPAYCKERRQLGSEQNPQIPLESVTHSFTPGLIQLPTGVQVVLIPKDLLVKNTQCPQAHSNVTVQCKQESFEDVSSIPKVISNQTLCSDSEPDSTVPCETLVQVNVTATKVHRSNIPPYQNQVKNNRDVQQQQQVLDLSINRNNENNDSMWRPW